MHLSSDVHTCPDLWKGVFHAHANYQLQQFITLSYKSHLLEIFAAKSVNIVQTMVKVSDCYLIPTLSYGSSKSYKLMCRRPHFTNPVTYVTGFMETISNHILEVTR